MFFSRAPSALMVFQWFCQRWTITIKCFLTSRPLTSMVFWWFSDFLGRWLTMVWKLQSYKKCVNSTRKKMCFHNIGEKVTAPTTTLPTISVFCREHWQFQWFWRDNWKLLMVMKRPLKIFNGFGGRHYHWMFLVPWPLPTMVFQWFLGRPTIGFNGFRWSRTIGQTMEWFQWIEQV